MDSLRQIVFSTNLSSTGEECTNARLDRNVCSVVSDLAISSKELRRRIQSLQSRGIKSIDMPPRIVREWMKLVIKTQFFHLGDNLYVRAVAKGLELCLHLAVFDQEKSSRIGPLAQELRCDMVVVGINQASS